MKLYRIRGGNLTDLENKIYTIGVGISLGNKWFNVKNITDQIRWALHYTKDKVVVYVADSIHAINLEVRNRKTFEKALIKANQLGDQILKDVKDEVNKVFSVEEGQMVVYSKWNGVEDESYKNKVRYLRSLYRDGLSEFQARITSLVRSLTVNESRKFSDADILRLGEYLLEEMPELIDRVPIAGVIVDAYTYPFDGEVAGLAEQIQLGKIFPDIKNKIMDTEPKVFLEVR